MPFHNITNCFVKFFLATHAGKFMFQMILQSVTVNKNVVL